MSDTDEKRWKQRLENFGTDLENLSEACEQDTYTNLERAGLIKTFEICFELSWNVLKDLLFYEGFQEKVPRAFIQRSLETGYINASDCELLLQCLKNRNVLSHAYRKDQAIEAENLIKQHYFPVLARLHSTLKKNANND